MLACVKISCSKSCELNSFSCVRPEWLTHFAKDFERQEHTIRNTNSNVETLRLAILLYAYEKTRGPDGLAHLGQLGMVLHALDSDFESHFGSKQLSKWLKAYPNVFTISGNFVRPTKASDLK